MNTYFSTFVTGFEKVVEQRLTVDIDDVKIIKVADGLIVYETKASVQKIRSLRFLNNSFLLIKTYKFASLDDVALLLTKNISLLEKIAKDIKNLGNSFRVICSNENQIVTLGNNAKEIENILVKRTVLDKANPDTELWFIKRKEGAVYVGLRLTRQDEKNKHLQKGQLRYEIAHLLCLMSSPTKDDVFLDPFAGYGAIVIERIISFPYTKVIAGEKDKQVFRLLQDKFNSENNVVVGRWDATNLTSLTNGSVDKIVTDPPWGIYSDIYDIEEFYLNMLKEFLRVLKDGGLVVVLVGQKDVFEKAVSKTPDLLLVDKLDVLISGKKAGVYKFKKK